MVKFYIKSIQKKINSCYGEIFCSLFYFLNHLLFKHQIHPQKGQAAGLQLGTPGIPGILRLRCQVPHDVHPSGHKGLVAREVAEGLGTSCKKSLSG
jgi:hypothetical protein